MRTVLLHESIEEAESILRYRGFPQRNKVKNIQGWSVISNFLCCRQCSLLSQRTGKYMLFNWVILCENFSIEDITKWIGNTNKLVIRIRKSTDILDLRILEVGVGEINSRRTLWRRKKHWNYEELVHWFWVNGEHNDITW